MPRKRSPEASARQKHNAKVRKRRSPQLRSTEAAPIVAKPPVKLSADDAIALYRAEKARVQERGGPRVPTSGRRPIVKGM